MSTITAAHVRRAALAAAPVLGALACTVGSIADPDPSATGLGLVETYTDNWDLVQWKSASYHYGYMFLGATAVGLAALVRKGRGARVALVASALAILGISTLPGMLISDFYASAGGQVVGPETMREIEVASQSGWGGAAIMIPGMLGFLLCMPVAAFAAVRGGLLRWYAPLLVLAGLASFAVLMTSIAGPILMTALYALLGLCIARIPVAAFGGREARDLADEPATTPVAVDAPTTREQQLTAV